MPSLQKGRKYTTVVTIFIIYNIICTVTPFFHLTCWQEYIVIFLWIRVKSTIHCTERIRKNRLYFNGSFPVVCQMIRYNITYKEGCTRYIQYIRIRPKHMFCEYIIQIWRIYFILRSRWTLKIMITHPWLLKSKI